MSVDCNEIGLTLRPIVIEDEAFLLTLFALCRPDLEYILNLNSEVKDILIRQQYEFRTTELHRQYPNADMLIVMGDNEPIGKLFVERGKANLHILELGLLPAFRGKGIGSRLMQGILDEAREGNKTVSLHVDWYNLAAKELYHRLGFHVTEDTGVFCAMQWPS